MVCDGDGVLDSRCVFDGMWKSGSFLLTSFTVKQFSNIVAAAACRTVEKSGDNNSNN